MYFKMHFRAVKVIIAAVACCLLVTAAAAADDVTSKVGFVDLQRLVNESPMGKTEALELQQFRQEKQSELNEKSEKLNTLSAEIESGDIDDAAERRRKLQRLQDMQKQYQRMAQDAQDAIERKDNEIVARILTEVAPVLQEVAEREGYTMIIKNRDALAYVASAVNITELVLEELDAP